MKLLKFEAEQVHIWAEMQVTISYAQTSVVCKIRNLNSVLITIYRAGCQCSRLCIAFQEKIQYNKILRKLRDY